jgi:hypothetical protein
MKKFDWLDIAIFVVAPIAIMGAVSQIIIHTQVWLSCAIIVCSLVAISLPFIKRKKKNVAKK